MGRVLLNKTLELRKWAGVLLTKTLEISSTKYEPNLSNDLENISS